MKNLLSEYSAFVTEPFNEKLIKAKTSVDIEKECRIIFKSLETIPGIHVNSVKLYTNEENIKPIFQEDSMYKQVTDTRTNRLHYSVSIDEISGTIENDINILKIVDDYFFVNDGVLYYPIWQVTPIFSYHTHNGIVLKNLSNPFTIIKNKDFSASPCFGGQLVEHIPTYNVLLFKKSISMLYFFMARYAIESLENSGISIYRDSAAFESYQDPKIIDHFNKLLGTDIKFSDDPTELNESNRTVFQQGNDGIAFSIHDSDVETPMGKFVISLLLNSEKFTGKTTKKILTFNYKDLITPWFWVSELAKYFVRGTDCIKRWNKAKGIFISLDRLIDPITKESMPIEDKYKVDAFSLMLYVVEHFSELIQIDNSDLKYMKLSLYEFMLFPLRLYINRKINDLLSQQTITADDKKKIFNKLNPMFLIKALVNDEKALIRTYNSSNFISLFTAGLSATLASPQSVSSNIPVKSRDLKESFVGRISIIRSSPSNPGMLVTLCPMCTLYTKHKYFEDYSKKHI